MLSLRLNVQGFCLIVLLACTVAFVNARSKPDWDLDEDWFDDESKVDSDEKGVAGKTGDDHSNHHHLLSVGSLSNSPSANWDGKQSGSGGLQGGSFSAHNQSCGPNRPSCIPESNLVCSSTDGTGRCICTPGFVYVRDTETCWVIPRSEEDPCGHDVQCHTGRWGEISRCSKHTGRCECYDYKTSGKRETTLTDGVCYIRKTPGDLCNSHEECDKAIDGDAYCQVGNYTGGGGNNYTGACQCRDTHTWYKPLEKCLAKSTQLNDACVITQQCREGTLGKYSRCNADNSRCECWAGPHNSTDAVYCKTLKKCFPKKEYNETCEEDDECRASLGPEVKCGRPSEEYSEDENVCFCPKAYCKPNSGFSTVLGASSLFTMGFACVAAVIGMRVSMNGLGGGM